MYTSMSPGPERLYDPLRLHEQPSQLLADGIAELKRFNAFGWVVVRQASNLYSIPLRQDGCWSDQGILDISVPFQHIDVFRSWRIIKPDSLLQRLWHIEAMKGQSQFKGLDTILHRLHIINLYYPHPTYS
jgi:hypothetical protein